MIYLKRFLYILIMSILCVLGMFIAIFYVALLPIGMIISFILTEDFTRYFAPLEYLGEYLTSGDGKLEDFFLK